MTFRNSRRVFGALAALTFVAAACSNSDDVNDVRDITSSPSDSTAASDVPVATEAPPATDTPAPDSVAPETDGFVFEAPTGDYEITFPGEPELTPLPVPLPTGQVTAEAFLYEDGIDAAYFTSAFDYPPGSFDDDTEVVLTGARDGAINNVGATLGSSEFVESNGVAGIAFTFELTPAETGGPQAGVGTAIVYFDAPRLYQSFALGFVDGETAYQDFVDSFMFTETPAGDS